MSRLAMRCGLLAATALLAGPMSTYADSTAATSSGNWNDAIWNNGAPDPGDDVTINVGVTVTNNAATPSLASFTNNGTLVFSGWNSSLTAIEVVLNGTATLPAAFTDTQMSNRVYFVCSNLTLAATRTIEVSGLGYKGATGVMTNGYGTGGGQWGTVNGSAAGSYGGQGGWGQWGAPTSGASHSAPGSTYGSKSAPVDPGSGGGGGPTWTGGSGGGAVRIDASGHVLLNGNINANGTVGTPNNYGGGSGGGIYITCRTFGGTNGWLRANGGYGSSWGGAGGGGRIAIVADTSAQPAMPQPSVYLSCRAGTSAYGGIQDGGCGTGYANVGAVLPEVWANDITLSGFTNYAPGQLIVTNSRVVFEERVAIAVSTDVRVSGGARLDLMTPSFSAGGNILVSNATVYAFRGTDLSVRPSFTAGGDLTMDVARLYVYAGTTNTGAGTNYDVSVSAAGTFEMRSTNCWVYPYSHPTNGGNVRIAVGNFLNSTTNSGVNADYLGFGGGGTSGTGYGPGGGTILSSESGGGGYGGRGGDAEAGRPGGGTYGSKSAPIDAGSGSAMTSSGGGVVRIEATGHVLVNGTLTARGSPSPSGNYGAASGGSIYINCQTFASTNGIMTATGGSSAGTYGGGGGGGRIAIVCNAAAQQDMPRPTVAMNAAGGTSGYTQAGTWGTVYANHDRALPETWAGSASLSGFTNYAPSVLLVTNSGRLVIEELHTVSVVSNLSVVASSRLDLHDANFSVGRDAVVSNASVYMYRGTNLAMRPSFRIDGGLTLGNAALYVYAATTNTAPANYDVGVTVGGQVYLGSNGWIYPLSHGTNGGSIKFSAGSVNIAVTNSGFFANALGFVGGASSGITNGYGPGAGVGGQFASGGGYGGEGGHAYSPAGAAGDGGHTYGSSNAPVWPGSGGGGCNYSSPAPGGKGGGLIWLDVAKGDVAVNGLLTANGSASGAGYGPAGGSGGGIFVVCKNFTGASTGRLSANGAAGSGWGSPGGGGRIAVWSYDTNGWLGTVTADGVTVAHDASRTDGATGTVVWVQLFPPGTTILVR